MADNKKISELDPASDLSGNEQVELLQVGSNVRATLTKIKTWIMTFVTSLFLAKKSTVVVVTDTLDLSVGYESGTLYSIQLEDSEVITITIPDASEDNVGNWAKFIKYEGENASATITNVTGDYSETISGNNGFTLNNIYDEINDTYNYTIIQDSRSSASTVSINFLPTDTVSILESTYYKLVTESFTEATVTSDAITETDSDNPQSLGFWINDNKALFGLLAETDISAVAQINKTSDFNRNIQIRFVYYEYDYETSTLNTTPLITTSYSSIIDYIITQEVQVSGTLPSNTWGVTDLEGKTLVIELQAIKVGSTGTNDDPTLDIRTGGTSPSKTTVNISAGSINHDTLSNVATSATSVTKGHVDNTAPLQFPERTTTEEGTDAHNDGQMWYNTTLSKFRAWIGGALQNVLLITDQDQNVEGLKSFGDEATGNTGQIIIKGRDSVNTYRSIFGTLRSSGNVFISRFLKPSNTTNDTFLGGAEATTGGGAVLIKNDGTIDIISAPSQVMTVDGSVSTNIVARFGYDKKWYIIETPSTAIVTYPVLYRNSSTGAIEQCTQLKQSTITSSATPTPTGDARENELFITALAVNTILAAPSGTAVKGNTLFIAIYGTTGYTLGLNAIYNDVTGDIPTSTTASKELRISCQYNDRSSKWDILSWLEDS